MIKHYLQELKPNGGGSMNDRLVRVEAMLELLVKGNTKYGKEATSHRL